MKKKHASIYHATEMATMFTETVDQPRKRAGKVEANDLEDAYMKTQNLDEAWNKKDPCRSTSVGDVIYFDGGYHMVKMIGFEDITEEYLKKVLKV